MDELTRELDKIKAPRDGGPAFPLAPVADPETGQFIGPHSTGMSLRDWFAGMAMTGLLACPDIKVDNKSIVAAAVDYADRLIAALEAK